MATVTRGKNKGEEVRVVQFCNDWFMVEKNGSWPFIVSPLSIELNYEEMKEWYDTPNKGFMDKVYELRKDGRFIRRKIGKPSIEVL